MLEKKQRIIVEKVQSGNFDLTSEEQYILFNDQSFFIDVFKICINFPNFNHYDWIEKAKIYDVADVLSMFGKETFIQWLILYIREDTLLFSSIQQAIDLSILSDQEKQLLKSECDKSIRSSDCFVCYTSDVIEMLNNKDYELISRVYRVEDNNSFEHPKLLERIKKEYPFNDYDLLFINNDLDTFDNELNNINVIYSIIKLSKNPSDNLLFQKIMERLDRENNKPFNTKLINFIDFQVMNFNNNSEKIYKFVDLFFKKYPLTLFEFSYEQYNSLAAYREIIINNVINAIDENTKLPNIFSYRVLQEKKIFDRLIETKHYKEAALFDCCLSEFDLLKDYIPKNKSLFISVDDFINIYNSTKNQDDFIKMIKNNELLINLTGDNIGGALIHFLMQKEFCFMIYKILYDGKYDIKDFISKYKSFFQEKILSNFENGSELLGVLIVNLIENKDVSNVFLSFDKYYFDVYLKQLKVYCNDNEDLLYNAYNSLLPFLKQYLNVDINKVNALKDKFGLDIVKYINEPKILELLNLNDNDFYKFINLFNRKNMSMKELDNTFDSIIQAKYKKEHQENINIFHDILVSIDINNDEYINIINNILTIFNQDTINYLQQKLNIVINNPKELLYSLVDNIKNHSNREESIQILNEICSYYKDIKRGEYKKSLNVGKELNLSYSYEEKQLKSAAIKEYIKANFFSDNKEMTNIFLKSYNFKEVIGFDINADMFNSVILLYLGLTDKTQFRYDMLVFNKLIPLILKHYEKSFNDMYFNDNYYERAKINNPNLKKIYEVDEPYDFYQVLLHLDYEKVSNDILHNEEVYNMFIEAQKKLKIECLPKSLLIYINDTNAVDFSMSLISTYINYFTSIMKDFKSQNKYLNIATISNLAGVYDATSVVFKKLLGEEDFKLIKTNPEPNAAQHKLENNQRIIETTEQMIKNYHRDFVTIPAFNNEIELSSNKKIKCVVGNFTNPCNMTLGERTGSCMRIGGVGESLFNFCNNNENGFHIRFENEQNKFVSRVSGFRNGNTVFLNELRFSEDDNYDNDDLLEATKIIANKIIEYSKNTRYPIQNVVLHDAYVADNQTVTNLQVNNIKQGLPYFYSDVNSNAFVVASVNPNGFAPLDLNPDHVTRYRVARDVAKVIINENEFMSKAARINGIIQVEKMGSMDYIDNFVMPNGYTLGIVGDDYYIYVDKDLNIIQECIGHDDRSIQELEESKNYLETYINSLNENMNK